MDADWVSDEYTYLSENELRFLLEGETDSRPAGTLSAKIDAKVEDLDEYLATVTNEIALLHAEGYLDRNLSLEDIASYSIGAEDFLPLRHVSSTDDTDHTNLGYQLDTDHIDLGYRLGHLTRTLYEGTTPTNSPRLVLFGFAVALLADHPTEDMHESAETDFEANRPHRDIENYTRHTSDIVELGDSYADLIEAMSSPDVYFSVDPLKKTIYNELSARTVPTKPLRRAVIEHIDSHDVDISALLDPDEREFNHLFYELNHDRNLETYDAFAALVADDIQRISETTPGTLETRYVLQTVAESDDPQLTILQELKQRFPKASGKKQQNVARVRNNLLGKKDWERQFITEGANRYHLSSYGEFVSTIMFGTDSAHAVCHAYLFDQWEHVTATQAEVEPLLLAAVEAVDIPISDDDGEDTEVVDLDEES